MKYSTINLDLEPKIDILDVLEFNETGFIVFRNIIPLNLIELILQEIELVEISNKNIDNKDFYYEYSILNPCIKQLRRIERITNYCMTIRYILGSDYIYNLLKKINGCNYTLFKDKLNLKLPGSNGFRAHIDGHFYWIDSNNNKRKGWLEYGQDFINLMMPLDQAGLKNGCLEICPRNYTTKLFGNSWEEITSNLEDNGPYIKPADTTKLPIIPIEVIPGDIVLFSWINAHSSKVNLSKQSRRLVYATYSPTYFGNNRDIYYFDKAYSKQSLNEKMLLK